jgi:energy-coupling factor transporter ATP-binding protein EcfA2
MAALEGRAAQRPFVDELTSSWTKLEGSFAELVSAAVELTRAAAVARPPDDAHARVFSDLNRYLADGSDWRDRAAALSAQLLKFRKQVKALDKRVNRDTVNIGVIGVTGAGKSTLLRKLSGLDKEHIPSNRTTSSTATPSRIFNKQGPGGAELKLHTWESFREEVLTPLHRMAGLGPAPRTIEEFRSFPYPDESVPEGQAGRGRYYKRLRLAQQSLASYESRLHGGTEEPTLEQLRPLIAYPGDEKSLHRPYHAVRSADIFCQFPQVGAVRLGLVDLPGAGEAGLDVHERFLADLRNDTDLLFIVKRPTTSPATEQDWDAAQLADDAAAGVRRGDFAHQVINRDADLPADIFEAAVARARADGGQLGIDVRVCDLDTASPDEVAQAILAPILSHLAERLAYMDRDAVAFVLTELASLAGQVRSLSDELARQINGWQTSLPDEEQRRRIRVRALKNQVSHELDTVRDRYDKLYQSREQVFELQQQIDRAGREIRAWMDQGFGMRSTQEWLETFRNSISGRDKGHELDRQYNNARKQVVAVFGRIDISLKLAVERLWGEVAAAMREKLTDKIIPTGPDNRAVLAEFAATARAADARTLAEATERLLALRTDYGSIFLRVGRPVVRRIEWSEDGHDGAFWQRLTKRQSPGRLPDHIGGESATSASRAAPLGPATFQTGVPQPADRTLADEAMRWHRRLSAAIESVTKDLTERFHYEAQQTLRVLAAAIDLFKDTATATPEIVAIQPG